jgi:hypothetical protein
MNLSYPEIRIPFDSKTLGAHSARGKDKVRDGDEHILDPCAILLIR